VIIGDIRPRSFDDTRGIHAGNEWKINVSISIARACALARAGFRIGWIDARIADPDQYFTILRLRNLHVPQAQHIRLTVAIKNHYAHL
jgi:hypothetical protein